MSLLRSPRLCASDDGEGYCNNHPLLNTPAGDRDPPAWATEQWMEREEQKIVDHMMIWQDPIESWNQ
jgi:hypothetical protein